jgi:hypothetical protein
MVYDFTIRIRRRELREFFEWMDFNCASWRLLPKDGIARMKNVNGFWVHEGSYKNNYYPRIEDHESAKRGYTAMARITREPEGEVELRILLTEKIDAAAFKLAWVNR